ncbi:LLM class flavin-dependent oxidoreductase [Nocardia pseudovaccinii]|uniref:LLM class flavin-dependent oxidoreductase n=1 Tax=Nocardia pseudovaccinii TaxID=189540 RepID=UPI003D8D2511
MHIGIDLGFGNLHQDLPDHRVYTGEVRLATLAERLGFDSVWAVEHHFSEYSMCPDNILFLAHVAGLTERIRLGTGAVILPWHDPLRVAERMIMLDILSGGRALLGVGRGLARTEYEAFRIPMGESRDRFDEAARMVADALKTGFIEGHGPFYPQPRTQLRPQPRGPFTDRLYCVAGSPDSAIVAANLGARLLSVVIKPITEHMDVFNTYRDEFRARHGVEAPPIMCMINLYCAADGRLARERARDHLDRQFRAHVRHYEMTGDHFAGTAGYERYAEAAAETLRGGVDAQVDRYLAASLVGDPDEVLARIIQLDRALGGFGLSVTPSYGGMPCEEAEQSLELFGKEVLPAARGLRE